MNIVILGTGCDKCRRLYDTVREAVAQAGVEASLRKVEDIREIMAFKVLKTPAMAIDGEVRISGRVPTVAEVRALIESRK
ncbi:MAG: thioredoxin family protein [Deltaproteobacteria bacterium]